MPATEKKVLTLDELDRQLYDALSDGDVYEVNRVLELVTDQKIGPALEERTKYDDCVRID